MSVTILKPKFRNGIFRPKSGQTVQNPVAYLGKGRSWRRPAGGWMDDLAAIRQTILLCSNCQHKFNHKRVHYYREGRFEAIGSCDGCVTHYGKVVPFIHQSYLGQSWDPGL